MFLREVKVTEDCSYLRLVENYRQGSKVNRLTTNGRSESKRTSSWRRWRSCRPGDGEETQARRQRSFGPLCLAGPAAVWHAAQVLKVLKIPALDPPQPPAGEETLM